MLALIALAATLQVQPQSSPSASATEQIVVQGRDTKESATDYVEKLLPTSVGSEIGRFEGAVCPKVMGLAEPYNSQVVDRIRRVANATNIDVGSAGCTPNLLIITAADKRAMIDLLRKSHPGYLDGIAGDQLKRLADSSRPYAAWQVTDEVAADGMPIGKGSGMPSGANGAHLVGPAKGGHDNDTFVEGDFARLRTTQSPSRVLTTTKQVVVNSIVIIETGALHNATIDQLADFAFVKAMLPTEKREHDAPASSILSLFNPGVTPESGPQSLTWYDVAFLKSLRNTRSDTSSDIQISEMRDHIIREVNKVPAGQQ